MASKLKHIAISPENYERLAGMSNDVRMTFDDIVTKVLKVADAKVADPKEIRDSK